MTRKKQNSHPGGGKKEKSRQKMCSVVVVVLTCAICSPQVGRVSIPTVFIDKQKNDNVAGSENVVDGPLERILAAWRVIHCYSKIPRIRHDLQRKRNKQKTPNNFLLLPLSSSPELLLQHSPSFPSQSAPTIRTQKVFSLVVFFRVRLFCLSQTHCLSRSGREAPLFERSPCFCPEATYRCTSSIGQSR